MISISIIVPVFKVEQFLPHCIDSILNQTYTDFELLLIDDGSPDKSGEICDEYALKDKRICVFHKENGGVSSARNLGLEKARGKWVTFIDSDDWISNTFIEHLYKPILSDDKIEFVQAGCTNYIKNEIANIEQQYEYLVSDDPAYVFNHFRGLTFSKLFSLENVIRAHGLRFDEQMRITEDMAFTLDYIYHIKKYCFISEVGYYYRHNLASLTHSKKITPYKNALAEFKHLYSSVHKYIEKNNIPESEKVFRKRQNAQRLYATLLNLYKHDFSKRMRINHLMYDFTCEEVNVFKYLDVSFGRKCVLWLYIKQYYQLFDLFIYNMCRIKNKLNNFFL